MPGWTRRPSGCAAMTLKSQKACVTVEMRVRSSIEKGKWEPKGKEGERTKAMRWAAMSTKMRISRGEPSDSVQCFKSRASSKALEWSLTPGMVHRELTDWTELFERRSMPQNKPRIEVLGYNSIFHWFTDASDRFKG